MHKIPVSVGVPAYNEEKNIRSVLEALLNQQSKKSIKDGLLT